MMTMFKLRTACMGIALCGLLMACDRQPANAAGGAPAYDITTHTRPESIDGYLQLHRAAHRMCALARESMKLPPPPPLVELPPDFVTEKTTYLHSGGSYLTRTEEFSIRGPDAPESGCTTSLGSMVTETLVRNGEIQTAMRYADGTLEVDSPEPLPPPRSAALDNYSERKQIGGVALRCLPANRPLAKVMPDFCVLDTATEVPLDGQGQPVVVYARSTLLERGNIVLLTEPVKVQIGTPVSAARLALSKGR